MSKRRLIVTIGVCIYEDHEYQEGFSFKVALDLTLGFHWSLEPSAVRDSVSSFFPVPDTPLLSATSDTVCMSMGASPPGGLLRVHDPMSRCDGFLRYMYILSR